MMSQGKPFLIIKTVRVGLRLHHINTQKSWIRPGVYEVLAGDEWLKLEAAQPRVSTSAQLVRAVDFYGVKAESLLRLEEYLLANRSSFQMRSEKDEVFTVGFRQTDVKSSFYVSGNFLTEIKWDGMPLLWRIVLHGKKEFIRWLTRSNTPDLCRRESRTVKSLDNSTKIQVGLKPHLNQVSFMGTGYQATPHAGEPQVAIGDLSLAARLDITRAVAAGENVVVENIP